MKLEKVDPMVLTDTETGEKYTLEFNRDSVKFAEARGFAISDVGDFPMTKVPDLFFFAFRKNHRNIARSKTDKILLEDLKGLKRDYVERLIQLYAAPMESILRDDDEEDVKNAKVIVEM